MIHYPFWVADYVLKTAHLSDMEDLVYRRLLDLYYTQEGPIRNETDWVSRRIRMSENTGVVSAVLSEFFRLDGDFWHHERCDEEIAKYQKRSASARQNGKNGGRKPRNPVGSKPDANGVPSGGITRTILNTPHTPQGGGVGSGSDEHVDEPMPPGFVAFWSAWPASVRKVAKAKCLRAWKSRGLEPLAAKIVEHVTAMKSSDEWQREVGRYIPMPYTYLNQDRWMAPSPGSDPDGEAVAWDATRSGIIAAGVSLGLGEWDEAAFQAGIGETFGAYRARVTAARKKREAGHAEG